MKKKYKKENNYPHLYKIFNNKILNKDINIFILFFVTVFFAYFPAIKGPFILDDEHFIEKNKYIHTFNISKIYTTSVTEGAGISGNFYRPNQQLVYAILYKLFGFNTFPYHLLPILLHIINSFLIFRILLFLKFTKISTFISSLFYLIHPIQTEAISYISGLADPLGLFFILLGLSIFLQIYSLKIYHKRIIFLLLSLLLFILSFFTKENMVIIFPVIILVSIYLKTLNKDILDKFVIISIVLVGIVTICYTILRMTILNFSDSVSLVKEKTIYTENLHIRIITFITILYEYFKMIFFPITLNYEKPYTCYQFQ